MSEQKEIFSDGVTDDTAALNAWLAGEEVFYNGKPLEDYIAEGRFLITDTIDFDIDLSPRVRKCFRCTYIVKFGEMLGKKKIFQNEDMSLGAHNINSTLLFYEEEKPNENDTI